MKRTTRNPAKSRQEIIEKAAPVFNQHGFAGTKLNMLIEATGFQKGGIYCHFKNKTHLAREVFKHNLQLLKRNYQQEMDKAVTPKAQLLAFVAAYKKFIIQPPLKGGCPLLNIAIEADDTDETNRLLVKNYINEWKEEIEMILQKGIDIGDFNSDINITQAAFFIIAAIEGSIMLGQVKRSVGLMMGIADSLEYYFERCIFKG